MEPCVGNRAAQLTEEEIAELKQIDTDLKYTGLLELTAKEMFKLGGCLIMKFKDKPDTEARKGVIPFTMAPCVSNKADQLTEGQIAELKDIDTDLKYTGLLELTAKEMFKLGGCLIMKFKDKPDTIDDVKTIE